VGRPRSTGRGRSGQTSSSCTSRCTPAGSIEIVFSILQRKVLSPNDLVDLEVLAERIACFERRFNAKAQPFGWNFTRADLEAFLDKLHTHEDAPGEQAA